MARRTWSFALVGALIVGATALIYENTLEFYGSCGSDGKTVCTGYRTEVFGILLSQTEAVVWAIVIGAAVGGLLGLVIARVTRPG